MCNCTLCPFSGNKSSVASHRKSFHGELKKCSLCEYQGKNQNQIRLHNETKHQNITYDCDMCDTKLTSLIVLNQHKENKLEGLGMNVLSVITRQRRREISKSTLKQRMKESNTHVMNAAIWQARQEVYHCTKRQSLVLSMLGERNFGNEMF